MSRNIPDHPTAPRTYEAVNTFKRVALLEGKSLFLPGGVSLWTPDRFEPLVEHYVENLILSNDVGGFWKKLPFQIGHVECPGESAALFAEIFWIVTLASSSMTVPTKIEGLQTIWAMAESKGVPVLDTSSPLLDDRALRGLGSTKPGYNIYLWNELVYAVRLFKDFAEKDLAQRQALLADPWAFGEWMEGIDETKSRQLYHVLCHLMFPDEFERVFSEKTKSALARHPDLGIPRAAMRHRVPRDKALLDARHRIERTHPGQVIDYFTFPNLLRSPRGSVAPQSPTTTSPVTDFMEPAGVQADDASEPVVPWRPRNRIFFGPPGSGKTTALEDIRARRYEAGERVMFVSFHPSYSYEDFVEGYRPAPGKDGAITTAVVRGPFREICEMAHQNPMVRHTLFIDEINRANVAKVFGELITLLEPSKRCDPNPTLDFSAARCSARLQYSGEILSVPANLDIVASMNTADRSVQAIDRALRRRFEFIETPANSSLLPKEGPVGIDLSRLLQAINDRIEFLLDGDHAIGHALLMGVDNLWDLRRAFSRRVIPLLQEYFFEDLSKAKLALTGSSKESVFFEERMLDARSLFDASADLDDQELRVSIRPNTDLSTWDAADFLAIYLRGEELGAAVAKLPQEMTPDLEPGIDQEYEDDEELRYRARKTRTSAEEAGGARAANDSDPETGGVGSDTGNPADADDERVA
jgi:5-methylcytosine-specific restriction protein B